MAMYNGHKVWYAVCIDREDNDHGAGSYRKDEAIRMARKYRKEGNPDAYVVMVDPEDDYTIDEITEF